MSMFDIICDYSKKDVSEVPENVLKMFNLKMLYLEGNSIETLPDDFFERLTRLTWLDLRKNRLTAIPAGIGKHASLETLLLQDNNIEALPNEIGIVPNLRVLQLSGNPLKYPEAKILCEGVNSICQFLKQEYYKNNKATMTEDDEEREISVTERKSSSGLTKSTERTTSVHELLRRSAQDIRRKSLIQILPVIDVKSLSKTNSEEINEQLKSTSTLINVPSSHKKTHRVSRSCSKISLHSRSQWNSKRKLTDAERSQNEQLKEIWLKRLKELLADQEKILQQEKNLKALSQWRLNKKLEPPRSSSLEISEAPYGTDPESYRMLSRKDLTNQIDEMIKKSKKINKKVQTGSKKVDIQKLINDVVDQMKSMEGGSDSRPVSPRSKQNLAAKQIESIVELHKKIMALQTANNNL